MNSTKNLVIVVHGGAGSVAENRIEPKINGVKRAVEIGYQVLLKPNGTALEAVEAAVIDMENDEHFNAGYGSVLNLDGVIEMGASIMDGKELKAGAVAIVKDIANPISLARLVMQKSPHVLLGADGAKKFAQENNVPILKPGHLVTEYAKELLAQFISKNTLNKDDRELSTVGAVALDRFGNVAAATSTGGLNGKMVGRISDTPLIGCGTYATNEFGAVSTTGYGEIIMKYCLAHSIIKEFELNRGISAYEATKRSIDRLNLKLGKSTGAITVTTSGDYGIYFDSTHMSWAAIKNHVLKFGCGKDQIFEQNLHNI